ncbi:hypothetical protein CEXT_303631 [Caerostris extrusa]|uniref:Uncharacterized protein n=1 Tax=Caerostris extrusa TaxID=172846 RepID=A0AAV4SD19_CAEEX|nr:hypothetical protein CEXT_303631 [Caerostris extrusa]
MTPFQNGLQDHLGWLPPDFDNPIFVAITWHSRRTKEEEIHLCCKIFTSSRDVMFQFLVFVDFQVSPQNPVLGVKSGEQGGQ